MLLFKRIHFWVGLAGVVLFLLTGQYMAHIVGDMSALADGPRMLYRSAHIYLLLVSIMNLLTGVYLEPPATRASKVIQTAISVILLLSPVLIVYGFINESLNESLKRPVISSTLYMLYLAAILLVIEKIRRCRK